MQESRIRRVFLLCARSVSFPAIFAAGASRQQEKPTLGPICTVAAGPGKTKTERDQKREKPRSQKQQGDQADGEEEEEKEKEEGRKACIGPSAQHTDSRGLWFASLADRLNGPSVSQLEAGRENFATARYRRAVHGSVYFVLGTDYSHSQKVRRILFAKENVFPKRVGCGAKMHWVSQGKASKAHTPAGPCPRRWTRSLVDVSPLSTRERAAQAARVSHIHERPHLVPIGHLSHLTIANACPGWLALLHLFGEGAPYLKTRVR